MKIKLFLQTLILAIGTLTLAPSEAQTVIWERKALGQQQMTPCSGPFTFPNNNAWTQDQLILVDTACNPDQEYLAEPSNWSTPTYPNGASVDVILGNTGGAPTNLDRAAPISVHSVTILNVGGLTAEFGSSLTASLFDFQGDGSLPAAGGGGPNPLFTLTSGGTFKKSGGSGTYAFTLGVVLQVPNGGTVASQAGTLQLPGFASAYAGGVSFNAASGAVIDVAPAEAVDAGAVRITGLFTGTNSGGTVRLNAGWLTTVPGSGGATFNFAGNTFQWQSGAIGSSAADPFINTGTMNITGTPFLNGQGFTNQGTLAQSGAGALNLPFGRVLTNAATGTFDIRNDNGLTGISGGGSNPVFNNSGTLRKSAGAGTSSIDASIEFKNIQGTIRVETGTLVIPSFTQTGNGIIDLDGGTLILNGLSLGSGSLIGSGTINTNVNNTGGTVSPGHSAGRITVGGNYTQGANGVMTMEIGGAAPGTQYDQLQVSGTAALGGTLNVSLINGFLPAVGDTFQLLLAGSFTGTFSTVNTAGFTGTVNYSGSGITITVTSVFGGPSPTPTATPARLLNIATRMRVQTGENVIIGGFIIAGTDSKNVIIRGIGPSLAPFLSGALADPTLELFQGSTLLESNNDWKDTHRIEIEATGLQPSTDFESAIVRTLPPGSYTAILRGLGNTTGIGVVEAYDLNPAANSKLANIATRGFVEAGDNVMIGGLIIGPAGGANARVVVRAIGPSLSAFGIAGALQDPAVELKDANGSTLISNDDWQQGQPVEIQQLGLPPTDTRESALVTTLAPGSYTAIVRGAGNTTGVALVEVYHVQ